MSFDDNLNGRPQGDSWYSEPVTNNFNDPISGPQLQSAQNPLGQAPVNPTPVNPVQASQGPVNQPPVNPAQAGPVPQTPMGPAPAAPVPPVNAPRPPRPVQPYMEEPRGWSEPVYDSAPSIDPEAYTPGRYAYGAQNVQPPAQPPKKKKEKKNHWFLRAACLVLVCALVSGTASWAVVDYMMDHRVTGAGAQVTLGSSMTSYKELLAAAPVVDGEELTPNQISKLGDLQVVGVNTSVSTNIFGQSTTQAVSGSGFILSEDGYILTNYHVISYAVVYGGELTVMTKDGTKYPAQIVGYIESNDIAVIKIEATGLSPVVIGNSDDIMVGETVYAIGNPLGELDYSMTDGIVSALDRVITTTDDISGGQTSINMFQTTAAVNHGNSGGPVYNSRGEVIGIVAAKYADADEGIEGLGFAIPINDAMSIATQLIEHGFVASAGLNITGEDASSVFNQFAMDRYGIPNGVVVDSVDEGGAAEAAGIQAGDIITALGDTQVTSMNELKLALRRYSPGDTESITVYRMNNMSNGETKVLTITFGTLEQDGTNTQQQQQQQQQQGGSGWPWGYGW